MFAAHTWRRVAGAKAAKQPCPRSVDVRWRTLLSAPGTLLLCLAACAPQAAREHAADNGQAEALRRLLQADNGLQVRAWTVSDNPVRIGEALARYRDGRGVGPQEAANLRRNGIRLVRVRADSLDALLGEVGIAPVEVRAWHGQVHDWRQLRQQALRADPTVIAVGDAVRRFEPGVLRLMARCWTTQMEDGPYMNLELVPIYERPRLESYHRLLGDRRLQGEPFTAMAMELLLADGYAYVLTGESPAIDWPAEADAVTEGSQEGREIGPTASTPPTVGEFLFAGDGEPRMRELVVFVPLIPPRLHHPLLPRPVTRRPALAVPPPEGSPQASLPAELAVELHSPILCTE